MSVIHTPRGRTPCSVDSTPHSRRRNLQRFLKVADALLITLEGSTIRAGLDERVTSCAALADDQDVNEHVPRRETGSHRHVRRKVSTGLDDTDHSGRTMGSLPCAGVQETIDAKSSVRCQDFVLSARCIANLADIYLPPLMRIQACKFGGSSSYRIPARESGVEPNTRTAVPLSKLCGPAVNWR